MSKNRFIVLASKDCRPKFIRKVIRHKSKLKRFKKLKEENSKYSPILTGYEIKNKGGDLE